MAYAKPGVQARVENKKLLNPRTTAACPPINALSSVSGGVKPDANP